VGGTAVSNITEIINHNLRRLRVLEKAINLARMPEFENLLRKYEAIYDITNTLMSRELKRRGYLLMVTASGDKIAFARDDAKDSVPDGYAVFTESELKMLRDGIPRLILEAKRLTKAELISIEKRVSRGGDGFRSDESSASFPARCPPSVREMG
jgi:hypothetical protein